MTFGFDSWRFSNPRVSQLKSDDFLWRYMDFSKFVSLLTAKKIILPQVTMFQDPYEGLWPKRNIEDFKALERQDGYYPTRMHESSRVPLEVRRQFHASCWHFSNHQSAAMWDIYSKNPSGVAIKVANISLLKIFGSSRLNFHYSLVDYIDYEKDAINIANSGSNDVVAPFFYKRESFSHEKEFRVIFWKGDRYNMRSEINFEDTVGVDVENIDDLIEEVVLSPYSEPWFLSATRAVAEAFGLNSSKVHPSNLYGQPDYLYQSV
jgi:hypothetical protein